MALSCAAAPRRGRARGPAAAVLLAAIVLLCGLWTGSARANAAPVGPSNTSGAAVSAPDGPAAPSAPSGPSTDSTDPTVSVQVGTKPSQSVSILLLITILGVAPSLLLLVTSFTKIFVVLSLTRNALGLSSVPPNQVLAGLSLFLSMFVMAPVLSKVNTLGIQPYL